MSKHIVVCSDGTGNTAIKDRGTNVFKLFEAVDLNGHRFDPTLTPQVAIYDDGVGTESLKPLKIFAGATGWGLTRNVRLLYKELCRLYDPGDQIFLFGFSRGAFTVRTLGGLINRCGILDTSKLDSAGALESAVKKAYGVYRKYYRTDLAKIFLREPDPSAETQAFRDLYCLPGDVPIQFVGVWDTVDAVGTPFRISDIINATIYRYKFPDQKLNSSVRHACHAISIDDQRHTFHPLLWEKDDRIEQAWFSGAHSNVGGGYPKQGMSLVALDWMMWKAHGFGLRLIATDRDLYHQHANVDDKLYDPRAGLGVFYRWLPRDMRKMCAAAAGETPAIHVSVLERIAHGTEDYAPGNLDPDALIVTTATGNPAIDDASNERARQLKMVLRASHSAGPLLEQMPNTIKLGVFSYYLYLITCTAMVLAALVPVGESRLKPWVIAKHAFLVLYRTATMDFTPALHSLQRLATDPELAIPLVASLSMSLVLSRIVDARMQTMYSEFWHNQQPKLREALKAAHETSRQEAVEAKAAGQ